MVRIDRSTITFAWTGYVILIAGHRVAPHLAVRSVPHAMARLMDI